jgi:hypothetical protein
MMINFTSNYNLHAEFGESSSKWKRCLVISAYLWGHRVWLEFHRWWRASQCYCLWLCRSGLTEGILPRGLLRASRWTLPAALCPPTPALELQLLCLPSQKLHASSAYNQPSNSVYYISIHKRLMAYSISAIRKDKWLIWVLIRKKTNHRFNLTADC